MTEQDDKIGRMQMIEQNIQSLLMQKQQFQSQLVETNSALEELEKSEKTYKIIGNIMVLSKKEDLKNDLASKKEMAELRIRSIEKQEGELRDKVKELQEEVLKKMK